MSPREIQDQMHQQQLQQMQDQQHQQQMLQAQQQQQQMQQMQAAVNKPGHDGPPTWPKVSAVLCHPPARTHARALCVCELSTSSPLSNFSTMAQQASV